MKLLEKFENLFHKNSVQAACAIASYIHDGQNDKGGKPYILHPLWVSNQVALSGGSQEEVIVGLLHDTVEDSKLTIEELSEWFSLDIVNALIAISFRCEGFRKESREEYIKRVRNNRIAKTVKIIDLKHNMDISRLGNSHILNEKDIKRIQRYKDEYSYLSSYTIRH